MTSRTKSILTVAGTLLLGMVLGGLITGAVIGKRARAVASMFMNEERFAKALERIIEPNAAQRDSLHAVLKRYGAALAEQSRTAQQQRTTTLESFRRDVMPLLTPEQQERVAARFERMNKQRKSFLHELEGTKP